MSPSRDAFLYLLRGLPPHPQDLCIAWIKLSPMADLQILLLSKPRSRYWKLLYPEDWWVTMTGHRHLRRIHHPHHCTSRTTAQTRDHHPKHSRHLYPPPLQLPMLPLLFDPHTKMEKLQAPLLRSHRISSPDLTRPQPSPAHSRYHIPRLLILPMPHPHRHRQLPGAVHHLPRPDHPYPPLLPRMGPRAPYPVGHGH